MKDFSEVLKQAEQKASAVFKAEIEKVINAEKSAYFERYPFVAKISNSMGAVHVTDESGLLMFESDESVWPEYEEKYPDLDEDEIYEIILKEVSNPRADADDDWFICLLSEVIRHPVGFAFKEILNPNI